MNGSSPRIGGAGGGTSPGRRPIRYLGHWGNRPFGVRATQGFESSYQVDNSWRRAEELMTCRSSRLRSDVSPCENLLACVEFLLLSASPESFSSAASVASSVSAAMSLSSDLVFLESFFAVNRPSGSWAGLHRPGNRHEQ